MRALLEKCEKEWLDDFVYMSRQPLVDRGFEIVPFDGNDLKNFSKKALCLETDVVIGSVEAAIKFFELVGIETPKYIGYPKCLERYYGRDIQVTKFGDIKRALPYFIKPAEEVKKFTGCLIEKESTLDFLKKYDNLSEEDLVYVSDAVDILSEYRCFVHRNELKGIKHYQGDFKVFPDTKMVLEMIEEYSREANIAYTLDVGVLKNGETILIEINDMWAIGSYGLDGKTYVSMVVDRFQEIKKFSRLKNNL